MMIFKCIDCGRIEPPVPNPADYDMDQYLCDECALGRLRDE